MRIRPARPEECPAETYVSPGPRAPGHRLPGPPIAAVMMIPMVDIVPGCVCESLSMAPLTGPILAPRAVSVGFDPIWFGVAVVAVLEISRITPPVGLSMSRPRGVVGNVSTGTILPGATPFWIADIGRLLLITALAILVLCLPSQIGALGQ